MKPLKLKMKGLNSFTKEQTIDFEELSSHGIFGIFGPTGSGKSTILDGITLALYGEVARKSISFVNSGENIREATVVFTFRIGGSRPRIYQAERRYMKNKDPLKKPVSKSVLKEITGGNTVILEEGTAAVTAACEGLIGLKKEDFLRTVVLPQGKFSEFLMLSGKERNEMLERLFHLEQYGEKLSARIAAEKKRLALSMEHLTGRLTGYEGVSEESLAEMEGKLREILEEERGLGDQLKKAEKTEESLREIWQLEQEKKRYQEELARWSGEKEKIHELELALFLARESDKALPFIREALLREEKAAQDALDWQERDMERKKAIEDKGEAEKRVNEAEEEEKKLPFLQEKKIRLENVLPKILQRKSLEKEQQAYEKEIGEQQQKLRETLKKQETLEKAMDKLAEKKKEISEELKGCQVPAAFRQAVQTGLLLEKEAALSENAAAEAKKAVQERTAAAAEAMKTKRAAWEAAQEENRLLRLNLEKAIEGQMQEKEALEEEYGLLEKEEAEAKAAERRDAALKLRESLEPGKPCPVCGSLHYDWDTINQGLRLPETESGRSLEVLEEKLRENRNSLILLEGALAENKAKLEAANEIAGQKEEDFFKDTLSLWEERKRDGEKAQKKAEEAYREKASALNAWKEKTAIGDFKEAQKNLEETDLRREELEKQSRILEEKRQDLEKEKGKTDSALAQCRTEEAALKAGYEERQKQLKGLAEEIAHGTGGIEDPEEELKQTEKMTLAVQEKSKEAQEKLRLETRKWQEAEKKEEAAKIRAEHSRLAAEEAKDREREAIDGCSGLKEKMESLGLSAKEAAEAFQKSESQQKEAEQKILDYQEEGKRLKNLAAENERRLQGREGAEEDWDKARQAKEKLEKALEEKKTGRILLKDSLDEGRRRLEEKRKLEGEYKEKAGRNDLVNQLERLVKGKRFVEYAAREKLQYVSREASVLLRQLTRGNYQLECSPEGRFVVVDYKNGGVRRAVNTLSGGEVFLASLSLALALSNQIQLTNEAPLELFFLDEGFGTLDDSLLDTVMDALESLHSLNRRAIGLITHVEKIQSQMPVKLMVKPGETGGRGSEVELVYS